MSSKIGEIIQRFINLLLGLKSIIDGEIKNENNFEDLTPKSDLDKEDGYSEYLETLHWALNNNRIKNIALTGTYGAGKSSLLRTFEKVYPNRKYLNISLASFSIDKLVEENNSNRLLERSILQQIFYREKPQDIPESRFKRIFSVSKWKNLLFGIVITIWVFAYLEFVNYRNLSNLAIWNDFEYKDHFVTDSTIFIVLILGLLILATKLVSIIRSVTFSKLNFTKGEIEIINKDDSSILNNHLDEILYFFEKRKYDTVVIEDIDRFNNVEIFTKLRELNILLNQSEQVGRRVVFIYAIRDEFFNRPQKSSVHDKTVLSKRVIDTALNNRTKFFDFIIPIIPVINNSNSGEILLEKLKEPVKKGDFSSQYILDISRYIGDMRILINVYNEFILYRNKLNNENLRQENLLGMVVYKNKYPYEFSLLQQNQGVIKSVFNNKAKLKVKLKEKYEIEKNALLDRIQKVKDEHLVNILELRRLYIYELQKDGVQNNINVKYIHLNGKNIPLEAIIKTDEFKELNKSTVIQYSDTPNTSRKFNSRLTFDHLNQIVGNGINYFEREKIIKIKNENSLSNLKQEVINLERKEKVIDSRLLKELFNHFSIDEIIEKKENQSDLLIFLLRNGYIDEMYESYISYFYEGSLKREDYKFILSIKNHDSLEQDYALTNIDEIVKKLDSWEFLQNEILNFDLIEFLLNNESKFTKEIQNFILKLSDESDSSIKFILTILERESEKHILDRLFQLLSKNWFKIWANLENNSILGDDKKNYLMLLLLRNADIVDILEINKLSHGSFLNFLKVKTNLRFLFDNGLSFEKFSLVVTKLQIKFNSLEPPKGKIEKKLFQLITREKLYELNSHMTIQMIKFNCRSRVDLEKKLISSPYTTIRKSNCEDVIHYVENSIDSFVDNTLLKFDSIDEEQQYLIELLNNEEIELSKRRRIILIQHSPIINIKRIKNVELWNALILYSKIDINWQNILEYYNLYDLINEQLVKFINEEFITEKLYKSNLSNYESYDFVKFIVEFIYNEDIKLDIRLRLFTAKMDLLTNDQLHSIINTLPLNYNRLNESLNRPTFKFNDVNIALLEKLEEREFVSSIKRSSQKLTANVKYSLPE